MKKVIATVFSLLLITLARSGAYAQQRSAESYDLGPQLYSNHAQANGYQWRAWGYLYPPGTYTPSPGRPAVIPDTCTVQESVRPIGYYSVQGWRGGPAAHSAQYRITISGKGTWFFRGDVQQPTEDRPATSFLFDLAHFNNGALTLDDPPSYARFAPASAQCFGGSLELFFGTEPDSSHSDPVALLRSLPEASFWPVPLKISRASGARIVE